MRDFRHRRIASSQSVSPGGSVIDVHRTRDSEGQDKTVLRFGGNGVVFENRAEVRIAVKLLTEIAEHPCTLPDIPEGE